MPVEISTGRLLALPSRIAGQGYPAAASSTRSEKAGQASSAHGPKSRSVRTDEREVRHRIDPQERARRHRSARTSPGCSGRPIQCGALPSWSSKPSPQSQRIEPPDPGHDARPGPGTRPSSPARTVAGATSVGRSSSPAERGQVAERPVEPLRRPLQQLASRPSRAARGRSSRSDRLERRAGPLRDERAQGVEPGVRVDPPRPGRRERRPCLRTARPDAWASRCRTVAPGGPAGSSSVEQAPLRGDQHGQRRRELRHRCPAEDVSRLAAARQDAVRTEDRGGRMVRAPRVDRGQDASSRSVMRAKRSRARPDRDVWRRPAGPSGGWQSPRGVPCCADAAHCPAPPARRRRCSSPPC